MRLKVKLAHFDDAVGYDIEITHINATIQDYLDGLNHFQENYVESCKGCDGCCYERIPLTSIDVLKYLEDPDIASQLKNNSYPLSSFIENFCHVSGFGPVVDISLKRNPDRSCIFLNQKEKICKTHRLRSFVCQSFICLPHTERAGQLRDVLLNAGEDDLVHRYLQEAKERGAAPVIHGNNNTATSLKDYPGNIFTGKKHYHQILIKEVIPQKLWEELYSHASF
jgi:Fe-S-cluster containining protein